MKKIAEGYFYNVYDLKNGRVLKTIKTTFDRWFTVAKLSWFFLPTVWFEFKESQEGRIGIEPNYKKLRETIKDTSILGNVVFINETDYEQDRVTVVKDALKNLSLGKQKAVVDSFIENIFQCWRQGFSEQVFNFTINNGIDNRGEVILLDFDEITFDKSKVLHDIHTKRWLKTYTYRFGLFFLTDLKKHYKQRMDECMTEENLNKFWRAEL